MSSNLLPKEEINYRAIYGKLFSGLLNQFGTNYVSEIEDAIQNSFLKSLKIWTQNNVPNNKEEVFYCTKIEKIEKSKFKKNEIKNIKKINSFL